MLILVLVLRLQLVPHLFDHLLSLLLDLLSLVCIVFLGLVLRWRILLLLVLLEGAEGYDVKSVPHERTQELSLQEGLVRGLFVAQCMRKVAFQAVKCIHLGIQLLN